MFLNRNEVYKSSSFSFFFFVFFVLKGDTLPCSQQTMCPPVVFLLPWSRALLLHLPLAVCNPGFPSQPAEIQLPHIPSDHRLDLGLILPVAGRTPIRTYPMHTPVAIGKPTLRWQSAGWDGGGNPEGTQGTKKMLALKRSLEWMGSSAVSDSIV